jgi:putative transcriptional regulator
MAMLNANALAKYEASRNLGEELLAAAWEIKVGKAARAHRIKVPEILEARMRTGQSQQKFADVLGVSTRILQGWERGRRKPSGAARSLLTIAKRRPEVLRELFAE